MDRAKMKEQLAKLINLEDTPSSIALGAAIGIFWNFIPTLGLGFVVSGLCAKLLKIRVAASVIANLATGVFIPLFYTLNLVTGRILMGIKVTLPEFEGEISESIGMSEQIITNPTLLFVVDKIQSVSMEFVIGSIVNAFLAAILVYLVLFFILTKRKKYKARKAYAKMYKKPTSMKKRIKA